YWNKDGDIVATKNFKNGVEISGAEKETAPTVTEKHVAEPEPENTPKAEPVTEDSSVHKAAAEPETTATHEVKDTGPYVENSSGFAATMEEWKAMKKRKKHMPQVETATEEAKVAEIEPAPEPAPEPVHVPEPVAEQIVEAPEPVQPTSAQEVEAQTVAEIIEPAESEVEPVKEEAPAPKKKTVKSGGKFWKN
ncbi:MAG: hypothetical protein RQ824_01930, partial [bacterium]|nr:hypothetical protein [bacterium]